VDYNNIIIYKIIDLRDGTAICIDATTNFNERKKQYRKLSGRRRVISIHMHETGGFDKYFRMVQIEKFPCNSKREWECRVLELMMRSNMADF
jgi:hypothetical protein